MVLEIKRLLYEKRFTIEGAPAVAGKIVPKGAAAAAVGLPPPRKPSPRRNAKPNKPRCLAVAAA